MNERYYYIDRLKFFLICAYIYHQSLIAFGGVGIWYYTSSDRFMGVGLIVVNTIKTIDLSFLASLFCLHMSRTSVMDLRSLSNAASNGSVYR